MLYYKKVLHPNSQEWCVFIHGAGGSSSIWYKQIKAYSENFNLLLIDLRGHGKSKNLKTSKNYSFEMIAQDVIEVIEFNKIASAHFIGVSLGTIIIYQIFAIKPSIVKSMIFSGAITRLNIKSRLLLRIGRFLNPLLPYMTLYALLAKIIMPKKNHKTSRTLFVNEAKKLMTKEFNRWFKLTARLTTYLNRVEHENNNKPTIYIMGSEDHMFLGSVKAIVDLNPSIELNVVPNCGHVVNIDQAEVFNAISIQFIRKTA
ncbi:MAG: alpha/beta hydrolase [Crocinitomicaceae bacterium]